jgi:hypothetical protein
MIEKILIANFSLVSYQEADRIPARELESILN